MTSNTKPLKSSYKPSPGDLVLATSFDEDRVIHAVVAPGEEQRDDLKLCYLVVEAPGSEPEVIGELFYEEDFPYSNIRGLDPSWEPVRYKSTLLPTLAEVSSKTEEELQVAEYTYHQGCLIIEEARQQLLDTLDGLLCRYVEVVTIPSENGLLVEVVIHISPTSHAATAMEVANEDEKWQWLDDRFVFVFLDSTADGLLYGLATPAGFFTVEHLTAHELLSPDTSLEELEDALALRVGIQQAHDELVEALREEEEEEDWDEDDDPADYSDDVDDEITELLATSQQEELDEESDFLRAVNPATEQDELMALLGSGDRQVRAAVVMNPSLPPAVLEAYVRYGREFNTRLIALREFRKRNM